MKEIWKDITGYENYYAISNFGNIKAYKKEWKIYNYKCKNYRYISVPEKIMKPSISKCGYRQVNLQVNNKVQCKLIHRLVAQTFIDNPNNLPCVNHKDGNKLNNNVNNLEWCTYKENSKHSWKYGLCKSYLKGKYGKEHNLSKSVIQYDKNGNLIKIWDCISDVTRELKIDSGRITKCCKHQKYCHSAGGYVWEYKKSERRETNGKDVNTKN